MGGPGQAAVGLLVLAMAASAAESFEVASIRRSTDEAGPAGIEFTPDGGVRATNVTLRLLIEMAYDARPEQVSGGPGWTESERFVVVAKGPGGAGSVELARARLQTLLAERFQLKLRRTARQGSGNALVLAKGGARLTESRSPGPGKIRQRGLWEIAAEGVGMPLLARFLSARLGAVSDETGLTGRYDFTLKWMPALGDSPDAMETETRTRAALLAALQEQLGLRVERERVSGEALVIEQAERPGEN